MVVRGRAPVMEIGSPAVPAPLRVGRGMERSEGRQVRRQVAGSRVHGGNEGERDGARREKFSMPVADGGMF